MLDGTTIEFRGMARSPSLEAMVRNRIARLSLFGAALCTCRVVIEADWLSTLGRRSYCVRVDLVTSVARIAVGGGPPASQPRHDVCLAINDSFNMIQWRLSVGRGRTPA